MSRELEQDLSCFINVNMYLSPGSAQALSRHYDTHDVFVLQVHGQKKWRLFNSKIELPLEYVPPTRFERQGVRRGRRATQKDLSSQNTCALVDEFVLDTGDLLYVPRGFWHEAEALPGRTSCHLTLGLHSFTYLDLLSVAISQAAQRDPKMRKSLPLRFATRSDRQSVIQDQVVDIVKRFSLGVDSKDALAEVSEIFVRSRQWLDTSFLETASVDALNTIALDSNVGLGGGIVCRVEKSESSVSLAFNSRRVSLPRDFEAACDVVASIRRFTARELPGALTNDEKLGFVRRLVADGLLRRMEARRRKVLGPSNNLNGWLPVKLTFERGDSSVEWLYFGRRALLEPSFRKTIARLRNSVPPCPSKVTGLDGLTQLGDGVPPSGFIFHISRCGSTLLANALRVARSTIVVSEAEPLSMLLLSPLLLRDSATVKGWDEKRNELLRGVVRTFGQRRRGDEKALAVKFTSWNILDLPLVRRLWPKVPCVVIIRNPVEVAVSSLEKPSGWMRIKQNPAAAGRLLGWSAADVAGMSEERFCARTLGKFLGAAADLKDPMVRTLDHQNLEADHIGRVAAFFGLDATQIDPDGLNLVLRTHSKYHPGSKIYVDDSDRKQTIATESLRSECKLWADDAYSVLRARESEWFGH
jgi:hypothetical protein